MKLKLRQHLCNIKRTFGDERKPTGLSVEVLMMELCLPFDFRLLFTQCRLATELDFLTILKMVYWYSLLQCYPSGTQAIWQAD